MEEQLKAFLDALAALKTDITTSIDAIGNRCDALEKKLDAKKKDEDDGSATGGDDTAATRTAADSVSRGELQVLRDQVRALQIAQPARQSSETRNQMADAQAKADVAYRTLGESAPIPYAGEGVLDYIIRSTRPLLKHSQQFKSIDLHTLARDPATLNSIADSVRAEAVKAGLSPEGMPPHVYREIRKESAGGHRITEFVGAQSIFKTMSRPVKFVTGIGGDSRYPSGSGSISVRH